MAALSRPQCPALVFIYSYHEKLALGIGNIMDITLVGDDAGGDVVASWSRRRAGHRFIASSTSTART